MSSMACTPFIVSTFAIVLAMHTVAGSGSCGDSLPTELLLQATDAQVLLGPHSGNMVHIQRHPNSSLHIRANELRVDGQINSTLRLGASGVLSGHSSNLLMRTAGKATLQAPLSVDFRSPKTSVHGSLFVPEAASPSPSPSTPSNYVDVAARIKALEDANAALVAENAQRVADIQALSQTVSGLSGTVSGLNAQVGSLTQPQWVSWTGSGTASRSVTFNFSPRFIFLFMSKSKIRIRRPLFL